MALYVTDATVTALGLDEVTATLKGATTCLPPSCGGGLASDKYRCSVFWVKT